MPQPHGSRMPASICWRFSTGAQTARPSSNGPSPDHTEVVLGALEVLFGADEPGG